MTDERAAELLEVMRALTLAIIGLTGVLLEDGEQEAGEPAPVATYADGSLIG